MRRVAITTDGEDLLLGINNDGELALGTFDDFRFVVYHITAADPEVVLVVKNGHPEGEAFLEEWARGVFGKPTCPATVEGDGAIGERVLAALTG